MVRKRVLGPEAIKRGHSGKTEAEGEAIRRKLSPSTPEMLEEDTEAKSLELLLGSHVCLVCQSGNTEFCLSLGPARAVPQRFPPCPHLVCTLSVIPWHLRQSVCLLYSPQPNTIPIQCRSLSKCLLPSGSQISF